MTEEDDDRKLEQLFERTGAEPSGFELTRMAARARELPARLERVPRRLPRWTWAPAFAAVTALGALGVTLTQTLAPERDAAPSAPARALPPPKPLVNAAEDPSARLAASSAPAPSVQPDLVDEAELDALSLVPEVDGDPFDLSSAEERELSQ